MVTFLSCQEKSDEELVKMVLNDREKYSCLVDRYADKITRYVSRISNFSKEDREDIVQDIFVSAYKNINSFDSDLKFSSWLYRIAHNKVISFWRKQKVKPGEVSLDGDEKFSNLLKDKEDIFSNLNKKLDAREIRSLVGALQSDYREVLVLRFMEDKDYQEISDILEKPSGTVASLINRAKKELKKMVQESNFEF